MTLSLTECGTCKAAFCLTQKWLSDLLFLFFYFLLCMCSGNDAKPCHAPPWACEQKTQAKLANCCVCSAWQYKRSLIPTASGIDMHWMAFFSCLAHLIFGMPKKQRGYPGGDSLFFFLSFFITLYLAFYFHFTVQCYFTECTISKWKILWRFTCLPLKDGDIWSVSMSGNSAYV